MNTLDKNLTQCLKDLAAGHSYMGVHTELLRLMKEEYASLKSFFDVETPKKKRNAPQASQQAQASQAPQGPPLPTEEEGELPLPALGGPPPSACSGQAKLLANTKIRIIKRSSLAPEPEPKTEQEQKPRMESKELKAWQKEQEAKKLAELTATGISPESLLTAESIKRWVEDEGRTFAYVAREYVGLPEATVADFAKSHGVKSKISKSRAMLSAFARKAGKESSTLTDV